MFKQLIVCCSLTNNIKVTIAKHYWLSSLNTDLWMVCFSTWGTSSVFVFCTWTCEFGVYYSIQASSHLLVCRLLVFVFSILLSLHCLPLFCFCMRRPHSRWSLSADWWCSGEQSTGDGNCGQDCWKYSHLLYHRLILTLLLVSTTNCTTVQL